MKVDKICSAFENSKNGMDLLNEVTQYFCFSSLLHVVLFLMVLKGLNFFLPTCKIFFVALIKGHHINDINISNFMKKCTCKYQNDTEMTQRKRPMNLKYGQNIKNNQVKKNMLI